MSDSTTRRPGFIDYSKRLDKVEDFARRIDSNFSRVSPEMWDKAKTRWERNKLRLNVFIEDYSVEIQTAAVIVAGVILTDRIVRSNMSVKDELRWLRGDLEQQQTERFLQSDEKYWDKENLKDTILRAKNDGRPFEYYPGLGVLFDKVEDSY